MKKFALPLAAGLLLLTLAARAAPSPNTVSVVLAWDRTTSTNVITNYAVYFGSASRAYTNSVSSGTNLTVTVSNLPYSGPYFFAATAKDKQGLESDYSSEISLLLPVIPKAPANLRLAAQ